MLQQGIKHVREGRSRSRSLGHMRAGCLHSQDSCSVCACSLQLWLGNMDKKNHIPVFVTLQDEERTVDKDEEIPMVRRRPLPRGRARKRAIAVEDRETGKFGSFSMGLFIYFNNKNNCFTVLLCCVCVF